MDLAALAQLNIAQLKDLCRVDGLKVGGNKGE